MIFIGPTTREEVELLWLKSEWTRFQLPSQHRELVDKPDPGDPKQNEARSRLLQACRGAILDEVPPSSTYRRVRVEEGDFSSLFLLTCWDWFLDTGRTFELMNTLTNLAGGRGGDIGGSRQLIDHLRGVDEKTAYIEDYDAVSSVECLFLVASDENGPYTIIDGTHRAVALLREHQRKPNTPWNAVLIDSPRMTSNRWHIEYHAAPQILAELNALADQGKIW